MHPLFDTSRLDRTAFAVGTHADEDQMEYWRGKPYEARLSANEFL